MTQMIHDAFLARLKQSPNQITDNQAQLLKEQLCRVLACLTPRQEKVLRMRYGINEDHEYSLDEIAKWFGLSKTQIHRIQMRALEQLEQSSPKRVRTLKLVESPPIDM